jgi:hypothetical protein
MAESMLSSKNPFRSAKISENLGYAYYRLAMQSGSNDEFRARCNRAIENYEIASRARASCQERKSVSEKKEGFCRKHLHFGGGRPCALNTMSCLGVQLGLVGSWSGIGERYHRRKKPYFHVWFRVVLWRPFRSLPQVTSRSLSRLFWKLGDWQELSSGICRKPESENFR